LKIGLTKKGCNGLTYSMNYIGQEGMKKFDEVVDIDNGIKVIIDSKAIMAILGT
jgi:Fe-S cluster assembly iron-binding protein IscA